MQIQACERQEFNGSSQLIYARHPFQPHGFINSRRKTGFDDLISKSRLYLVSIFSKHGNNATHEESNAASASDRSTLRQAPSKTEKSKVDAESVNDFGIGVSLRS